MGIKDSLRHKLPLQNMHTGIQTLAFEKKSLQTLQEYFRIRNPIVI